MLSCTVSFRMLSVLEKYIIVETMAYNCIQSSVGRSWWQAGVRFWSDVPN